MKSANCDLFRELFELTIEKAIRLQIRWMPSHLKLEDPRPQGVSDADIFSNSHADIMAGRAAERAAVSKAVADKYVEQYMLAERIQRRHACIIQTLPERKHDNVIRPPGTRPPPLEVLVQDTKHNLKAFGERLVCTKCLSGFSKKDPAIRHWLVSTCSRNLVQSLDRPNPIDSPSSIHIGNKCIHVSHTLQQHNGLVYCKKCGN